MKTMSTKDLHHRLSTGPVALYDVRGDIEFEIGHIPGAKTAPLGSLTDRVACVMNKDSMVVLYSTDEECGLCAEAAERLANLGLTNVHVYEPGLAGWRYAGYPVVASAAPKVHVQGDYIAAKSIVVDTDQAYGGAFKTSATQVDSGGG